jgi:hypothetical protein
MRWFRQQGKVHDLETELRASRPEARDEFVRSLSQRMWPARSAMPRRLTIAIAVGVTGMLLAALASAGVLQFASKSVTAAATGIVKKSKKKSKPKVLYTTASLDQYEGTCGKGKKKEELCRIRISDEAKNEGNPGPGGPTTPFDFKISIHKKSSEDVTVRYQTKDGSATEPSDYGAVGPALATIAKGKKDVKVTVPVVRDTDVEDDEEFFVILDMPSDNAIIEDDEGSGVIKNDDGKKKKG